MTQVAGNYAKEYLNYNLLQQRANGKSLTNNQKLELISQMRKTLIGKLGEITDHDCKLSPDDGCAHPVHAGPEGDQND